MRKGSNSGIMTLLSLFWSTFKIGAFTFGGGYAMIPVMEREFVKNKKWIPQEEIANYFTVCQSVPGVISLNTAAYVGYRVFGVTGAISAILGISLPSVIIVLIISSFYSQLRENEIIASALFGLRACVVGLVINALFSLSRDSVRSIGSIVLAAAVFIAVVFFNINPAIIFPVAGIIGYIAGRMKIL